MSTEVTIVPGPQLSDPEPDAAVMQRARGQVLVAVKADGDGRTQLCDLYQEGCLKLRLPRGHGTSLSRAVPEAVLINTAGGLTGGDTLRIEAEVGAGASLALATQTAERLYRAVDSTARIETRLRVGAGGRLAWLPQDTILFEGSALHRTLDVDLAEDARFLCVESLVFGRAAMGERIEHVRLRDDWRIRVGGRLVHAEALRLGPDAARELKRSAGWNGGTASASVLGLVPDASRLLPDLHALIGSTNGQGDVAGAADAWDGGSGPSRLVVRLVARDGFALRSRLVPLLALLNAAIHELEWRENGQTDLLPAVWSL